jgi:hypothetical protein
MSKLDFTRLFKIDPNLPDRDQSQAREYELRGLLPHVEKLLRAGVIDLDTAKDASCGLAGSILEEQISRPEDYDRLRSSGEFDQLREIAHGRTIAGESNDGAAARVDRALRTAMTHLYAAAYKGGGLTDREYIDGMQNIDPAFVREQREELGLDQAHPNDLDGNLRALDDSEVHILIHGNTLPDILSGDTAQDRKQAAAKPPADYHERGEARGSASDWSESKMEKFIAGRDRDEGRAREPEPQPPATDDEIGANPDS